MNHSTKPSKLLPFTLLALAALAGCDDVEADPVCELLAKHAPLERRVGFRALVANALVANALSGNALTGNGLVLASNGQVSPAVAELAQTAEGQQLLHYVIGCALQPADSLTVPTPDGPRTFDGMLGYAPAWVDRGLAPDEERGLSSCLLGHVNAFGVSVPISMRAEGIVSADEVEQEAFPIHEGAFFGSLAQGRLHACHAEEPDRARAQSADRTWRVCTDGDYDCGMVVVGACSEVCAHYDETDGWSDCEAEGVLYHEVSNVYLRDDDRHASCRQSE